MNNITFIFVYSRV